MVPLASNIRGWHMKVSCRIILMCIFLAFFAMTDMVLAEEYTFDISEIEKKPYHYGGYFEFIPSFVGLNRDSVLYKLNFYNAKKRSTADQYQVGLQLEGSLEKDIYKLYAKTYTNYTNGIQEETTKLSILEGYGSIKPSTSLTFDFGKKTLGWGKGYAWNPVAFVDRPKDPNEPELSREGFIVATADYTKSFAGPLKTFSFTPAIVPVYSGFNDDFGEINHWNLASKFYFLLYDTDIDFTFLTGGSKTTRYGFDFSRNITSNLEIHGEFSLINGFEKRSIDSGGTAKDRKFDAKNYLIGLRYLTESDTTFILEYYHNATGFSAGELKDFYSFTDSAYDRYMRTGNLTQLNRARTLLRSGYGRSNPATNYLYFRVSQKDPFDILYLTPAVTFIGNLDDRSFSVTPEVTYAGITNLELRLRTGFIAGTPGTEFGEKLNDYRIEFRARYYF